MNITFVTILNSFEMNQTKRSVLLEQLPLRKSVIELQLNLFVLVQMEN